MGDSVDDIDSMTDDRRTPTTVARADRPGAPLSDRAVDLERRHGRFRVGRFDSCHSATGPVTSKDRSRGPMAPALATRVPMVRVLILAFAHVLVLVLVQSGCGSIPRSYPGPKRPGHEVAIVRVARGKIVDVDGTPRFESALEILPGDHVILARFRVRGRDFGPTVDEDEIERLDCRCSATLLSGGRYRLELDTPTLVQIRSASVYRQVHRVHLVDESSGDRLFMDAACSWR